MLNFRCRRRRLTNALALAVAGVAIAAPAAQADAFTPGVTEFASRPAYLQDATSPTWRIDEATKGSNEYVAGVTDFPSRLGAKAEQAARARIARTDSSQSPSYGIAGSDFDWGAASIGAGIGAGAMLLAVVALRTRPRTRFARA